MPKCPISSTRVLFKLMILRPQGEQTATRDMGTVLIPQNVSHHQGRMSITILGWFPSISQGGDYKTVTENVIWSWNHIYQGSCGPHGVHMVLVGPRWALCWIHEPCYQGCFYLYPKWELVTVRRVFTRYKHILYFHMTLWCSPRDYFIGNAQDSYSWYHIINY